MNHGVFIYQCLFNIAHIEPRLDWISSAFVNPSEVTNNSGQIVPGLKSWWPIGEVRIYPYANHGAGIFIYIYIIFMAQFLWINIPYMEHLGIVMHVLCKLFGIVKRYVWVVFESKGRHISITWTYLGSSQTKRNSTCTFIALDSSTEGTPKQTRQQGLSRIIGSILLMWVRQYHKPPILCGLYHP